MKKNRIVALSMLTLMTFSSAEAVFANNSIASDMVVNEIGEQENTVLNIPDLNLRKILIEAIGNKREALPSDLKGTDPSETLYITDQNRLNEISKLSMFKADIKSLEGIEYLNNLEEIICNYNDLSGQTLDLSKNSNLRIVTMIGSKINSVNLNGRSKLEQLRLGENELSDIDLSTNTALKELALDQNKFADMDISKNIALEKVFFGNEEGSDSGNTIKSLDFSKHISMKEIDVENLGVESITGLLSEIRLVHAPNNNIKNIDLRNCVNLKRAVLNNNKLEDLDLKHNANLEWIYCSNNNLKTLDLRNNTKLQYAENVNYISEQSSKAAIYKENGKWTLDMGSIVGVANVKNVSNLSSGELDTATGKVKFESKPETLSYDYATGSVHGGQPHIALGTMKNVKLTLEERESTPPAQTVKFFVQYLDQNRIPKAVKSEYVTAEVGSDIVLNIPEGYKLEEGQQIPKVTSETKIVKINIKPISSSNVNKEDLKAQIDKAQALVDSEEFNKYTEASKHEVVQQLKYAKIVYEDPTKSQQSVDDQTNALIHFMKKLKEKPVDKQRVLKIPDEKFRMEIYHAINRAVDPKPPLEDGEEPYDSFNLYTSDIEILEAAEYIQIDSSSISDLTGLEYFKNIHAIEITNAPDLKNIDVSKNYELKSLDLSNTGVEKLNTGDVGIKVLKAENNKIKTLDLSKNSNLRKIELNSGAIESLKTGSINIEEIYVVGNKLTSLDLSKNRELKELFIGANKIENLLLPEKSKLVNINALDNNIKDIDLSKQTELSNLTIGNNEIKKLDVSKNNKLVGLACYENGMEELVFGENSELKTLLCDSNNLKSVDLSKLVKLENLDIKNNKLAALNLGENKNVRDLYEKELLSPQNIVINATKKSEDSDVEIKAEDVVGKENVANILSAEGAEYDSEKKVFVIKSGVDSFSYVYKTNSEKLPEMKVEVALNVSVIEESGEQENPEKPDNKPEKPDNKPEKPDNKPEKPDIKPVNPSEPSDEPSDPSDNPVDTPDDTPVTILSFTDITGHWAKENIEKAASKGLFKGTSETEFSPELSMTRGMFVTVLGRLADEKAVPNDKFTDVNKEVYYAEYIAWAEENGIVKGYGNGKFGPDDKVTREEMATIIARFMDYKKIELGNDEVEDFADSDKVSDWAKESVSRIQKSNLIKGKGNGIFDPKADSTRAEVATLMLRILENYIEK